MSTSFVRREIKFLIDARQRDALLDELSRHVSPDPHAAAGAYQVTSLYYDSPDLRIFQQRGRARGHCRKLRLRVYGAPAAPVAAASVEIKEHLGAWVTKRRVMLPFEVARAVCAGKGRSIAEPLVDEVTELVHGLALRPSCVVTYQRCAYVGADDLRLTFDTALACCEPRGERTYRLALRRFGPAQRVLMEVKVANAVPHWLAAILSAQHCTPGSFSKYRRGMASLQRATAFAERVTGEMPWTS